MSDGFNVNVLMLADLCLIPQVCLLHKNNIVLNSYELCVLCFVLISKPPMQVFMQSQLFQILLSRMDIDRGEKSYL